MRTTQEPAGIRSYFLIRFAPASGTTDDKRDSAQQLQDLDTRNTDIPVFPPPRTPSKSSR